MVENLGERKDGWKAVQKDNHSEYLWVGQKEKNLVEMRESLTESMRVVLREEKKVVQMGAQMEEKLVEQKVVMKVGMSGETKVDWMATKRVAMLVVLWVDWLGMKRAAKKVSKMAGNLVEQLGARTECLKAVNLAERTVDYLEETMGRWKAVQLVERMAVMLAVRRVSQLVDLREVSWVEMSE